MRFQQEGFTRDLWPHIYSAIKSVIRASFQACSAGQQEPIMEWSLRAEMTGEGREGGM